MLIEPDRTLPTIEDDQRLFICVGDPWDEALADIRNGREDSTFGWDISRTYSKGDWILTYLDTQPRVFLCWEQATHTATPRGKIWVDHNESIFFNNLVVVDDIERKTGLKIKRKSKFEGTVAQSIRRELITGLWYPRSWHGLDSAVPGDIADY
ncbi:hypothetical protein [Rhodococcoides fascians]|uniref:hypothetical protein n=1 Tax=Rhodococcoides fascians TaxID=1828 RepID=UPI00366DE9F0